MVRQSVHMVIPPIEQIRDGKAYPASDLFGLGATCFHLLTGISPFQLWMEHGYGWVDKLATIFAKSHQSSIGSCFREAVAKRHPASLPISR